MEEGENHVQVKPDSPVNYQTYMKKTPRTRWSKQETQVFYEGIQAFGINLSMVQQFLPERRTLHQIKLKYKLEERKNPLKIDDALSTPCKGERSFLSLSLSLFSFLVVPWKNLASFVFFL